MKFAGNKNIALVICLLAVLSGAFTVQVWIVGAPSTIAALTSTSGTHYFDYVLVIMLENKNYDEVIGSTSSPYVNSLASQYALATNFHNSDNGGSLPNYLTLLTGSGIGWASCNAPPSQCSGFKALTPSLVESLDARGLSWKGYMEGMPSNCYAGNSEYYSGPDGSVYYPRHDPFIYLSAVINNQSDCNRVVPAGSSDSVLLGDLSSTSTASSFMWLTPNGCNQSHDCNAAQADSYMATLIPKILSSTIFKTQNAALFLTWDEPSSGNHIPTLLVGPTVKSGFQSNAAYDHYSILKTIEANWNLPYLTSNDAAATVMSEFFQTSIQSRIIPSNEPTALSGWGGVRLEEAGQLCPVSGSPNSSVFPGECASSMEMHMAKIHALGYNIIRVDFVNQCNSPVAQMGPYSDTNLDRAIQLAKYYGLWIIVDWHGYHDLEPAYLSCWLSKWKPIIQRFMGSYTQLIWEPENEPAGGDNNYGGYISLAQSTDAFQKWIDQARALGDTHYIVVPNICAMTCNAFPSAVATGWPIVHDPIAHVFINEHTYLYYPYWSAKYGWNNATAEKAANMYYSAFKQGMEMTGFRALDTEGGAAWISGGPPDIVIGSASGGEDVQFTRVSLHFVQTLIYLFDHNNPRINWVMWPAGIWTQCCTGGGLYGALEPGGWGQAIAPTPVLQSSISTDATNIDSNQLLKLTSAATGGVPPYNYTWSFDDGSVGSGVSASHNYTVAGQHMVELKITDSTNVTSVSQLQVNVNLLPTTLAATSPIITIPPVKAASIGTPVRFTVTAYSRSPRLIILSALGLPAGANFTSSPGNPVSGEFSWAPLDLSLAGLHSVTFKAQESGTTSYDVKSVTIQVVSTPSCLICELFPLWALYLFVAGGTISDMVSFSGLAITGTYGPGRKMLRLTFLRAETKRRYIQVRILGVFQKISLQTLIVARKPWRFAVSTAIRIRKSTHHRFGPTEDSLLRGGKNADVLGKIQGTSQTKPKLPCYPMRSRAS